MRAALFRAVPFVAALAAAAPASAAAAPASASAAEPGERTPERGDRGEDVRAMRWPGSPGGETPLPEPSPAAPAETHAYPVDGPHAYGDGFGDRGGSHKGQDVMAACGTPLRAVRETTVRRVAAEAAAGRYIVLHDGASGEDYVYMHMSTVDVAADDHVTAGEKVGEVGRTGDATACHLHFEAWTAPGWYTGGHAKDPLSLLRSPGGS